MGVLTPPLSLPSQTEGLFSLPPFSKRPGENEAATRDHVLQQKE